MLEAAILVIFPMLVAYGGVSDLLSMTIRNRVSVLLIAGFVIVALVAGLPLNEWGLHALAVLLVFPVCLGLFAARWMGGGDAKLISAISLWIGFGPNLLTFLLLVTIYGAILTIGIVLMRQVAVLPGGLHRQEWLLRLHDSKSGIPYGITIAVAALQVYPTTSWFALIGS